MLRKSLDFEEDVDDGDIIDFAEKKCVTTESNPIQAATENSTHKQTDEQSTNNESPIIQTKHCAFHFHQPGSPVEMLILTMCTARHSSLHVSDAMDPLEQLIATQTEYDIDEEHTLQRLYTQDGILSSDDETDANNKSRPEATDGEQSTDGGVTPPLFTSTTAAEPPPQAPAAPNITSDIPQAEPTMNDSSVNVESRSTTNSTTKTRVLPTWMRPQESENQQREAYMTRLATRSKNKALQRIADILEEEETSTRVTRSSSGDSVLTRTPIVYIDVENPLEIASGRVIAFDVETSGFSNSDCIIEIGAVELIDGVRTGALFQSYICPKVEVSPFASRVHGLTNSILQRAPPIEVVLPSFLTWVGKSPLVAHNARFDMRMLTNECERLGLTDMIRGKKVFCTLQYYRSMFPGRNYALIDVYLHFKEKNYLQIANSRLPNHSALVDSEVLAHVFAHLVGVAHNSGTNST